MSTTPEAKKIGVRQSTSPFWIRPFVATDTPACISLVERLNPAASARGDVTPLITIQCKCTCTCTCTCPCMCTCTCLRL